MASLLLERMGRNLCLFSIIFAFLMIVDSSDSYWGLPYVMQFSAVYAVFFGSLLLLLSGRYSINFLGSMFFTVAFFAIYLTVFSLIYYFQMDTKFDYTYFNTGLVALSFISWCVFFSSESRRSLFVVVFRKALVIAAFIMALLVFLHAMGVNVPLNEMNQNIFHEEVVFISSAAFLVFLLNRPIKIGAFVFMLYLFVAALLTLKNTGFILTLIAILFTYYAYYSSFKGGRTIVVAKRAMGIISLLALVLMFVCVYFIFSEYMPGGNLETRGILYGIRYEEFFDSPLVGSFFLVNSHIDLGWAYLPSHSDFLDMLSGGGLLAVAMIIVPTFLCVKKGILLLKESSCGDPFVSIFALILLSEFVMLCFNPIIANPKIGMFYWLSLAYIVTDMSEEDQQNKRHGK